MVHVTDRSARADVRNPILGLPAIAALRDLDPAAQEALRVVLLDLQLDARQRAEKSWRTHKPPLAAYWSAVGVYAGHIARCLNRPRARSRPQTRRGEPTC
jgi:hypothetical protein